jgi:WD40 repeat protein
VTCAAISPDGTRIVAGCDDGTARLWPRKPGGRAGGQDLGGHVGSVTCTSFSPDGSRVLTGGENGVVRLWDVATAEETGSLVARAAEPIKDATFSPDGEYVLTCGGIVARLWELATGELTRSFEGHASEVDSVCFSDDAYWTLTAGGDGTVRLWHTWTAEHRCTLMSFRDGTWAVMDRDLRFDGSPARVAWLKDVVRHMLAPQGPETKLRRYPGHV